MTLIERIELWLTLHSADCNDDDVADLLVNAQDELARMDQENARLLGKLDKARRECEMRRKYSGFYQKNISDLRKEITALRRKEGA